MTNNANEFDAYVSLKNLGKYLNTDVGITCGKIEKMVRKTSGDREPVLSDGYNVKVNISNTAPTEPDYPLIVFMGVGLKVQFPKTSHRTIQRMKNESTLKVDLTDAPQSNPFPPSEAQRLDTPEYPALTSDEKKHGHVLFPGQSIVYDLSLTAKECPDITQIKLWVEGTISRRHLLHHSKEIPIASEKIVYQL